MDRRTVTVLGTFRGIISVVMNSIAILTKQRKAIQINFIFPPNVFSIVSVSMTACSNESVGRIVGAGKGTVREHITVKIIAYGVTVERDQAIVGVMLEAAVGRRGYVAHRVIVEGLGGDNRIITQALNSS